MKSKSLSRRMLICVAALAIIAAVLNNPFSAHAQAITPLAVAYGAVDNEKQSLDVYQPTDHNLPNPAIVLIHGGAGAFGDRSDLSDDAQALAAAGYVAFNIDYRLLTDDGSNRWPTQLDDAQLAVRWIRANAARYNVDPNRICALGHSSGGQLAALLGVRDTPHSGNLPLAAYSSRVACVVDLAGSVDPRQPPLDASVAPVVVKVMGGTASEVPDHYRDASPLAQVSVNTAPFLIFHGADDEMVSVTESREFVDALHKAGVEVVYAEFPHAKHFSWLGSWPLIGPETLAFLDRHLRSVPTTAATMQPTLAATQQQ